MRLPSADTIEGREVSTARPIIWSNGGPSVRNKSPGLFCISSSDDWPTLVPRRWSQLKAPSVKRRRLPDAEPQRRTHTHTHTHSRSLTNLLSWGVFSLSWFIFFLSVCLSICLSFFSLLRRLLSLRRLSKSPCQTF